MPAISAKLTSTDRTSRGLGAPLLAFGGLAAALGAATCCALPVLLAAAGLGTAWLGGIAVLTAPFQPLLFIAAAVCLASGAALLWRQRTALACAPGALCARPAVRGLTMLGLLTGFVMLLLSFTYA